MALRVRLAGKFLARHFGLLFGGVWLAVGLPVLAGGIALWQTEQRFAAEAVTVEGQVLTRDIVSARRRSAGGGGGRSTSYRVTYRFATPDGTRYVGSSKVEVGVWENLREQGPVAIAYLADDPASNRIVGATRWAGALIMGGLGAVFALAGGGIFAFAAARRWSAARLRRAGVLAEGTVLEARPTSFRINGVTQWRARYRYHDLRGRVHVGETGLLAPEEAQRLGRGVTGEVRYDRRHPAKSVWLGVRQP